MIKLLLGILVFIYVGWCPRLVLGTDCTALNVTECLTQFAEDQCHLQFLLREGAVLGERAALSQAGVCAVLVLMRQVEHELYNDFRLRQRKQLGEMRTEKEQPQRQGTKLEADS